MRYTELVEVGRKASARLGAGVFQGQQGAAVQRRCEALHPLGSQHHLNQLLAAPRRHPQQHLFLPRQRLLQPACPLTLGMSPTCLSVKSMFDQASPDEPQSIVKLVSTQCLAANAVLGKL